MEERGSIKQEPLYSCVGCAEDYSWPARNLAVHDGQCWCDNGCWDNHTFDLEDDDPAKGLEYHDLEPFDPGTTLRKKVASMEAVVEAAKKISKKHNRGSDGNCSCACELCDALKEVK